MRGMRWALLAGMIILALRGGAGWAQDGDTAVTAGVTVTPTPAMTLTPTPIPAGSSNRDWTPIVREFDGIPGGMSV